MLKITNANKYFNRGKKNEIHVIDNTSLEFDANGMVALLGPSGCGKTTLLNVIGGLDKIQGGDIIINDKSIARALGNKKDAIRNEYVGYIFQNYNLVEDMTVYDNVAIVLKMIGVKDKTEIEEKVRYVLEKVGMWRYRKRYANMLSGGERQRVGIARAIVKNPAIIIADEPTGNLDSKNTLEVMNIIKAISKDKLVILVTHEENLANFYATRIINIKDGKVVSDKINDHERGLDYVMDNRIYLGDLKEKEVSETASANINIFSNGDENVNLDIVIKNGNIYIRTMDDKKRIEVVDENSSMEIVEGKYQELTKEEQEKYQFNSEILSHRKAIKYSSTISVVDMLRGGFRKVLNYPKGKKILLVGFLISAIFILYAISNVFGVISLDENQFVKINKDYLQVENKKNQLDDYLQYEEDENVDYILPGDSIVNMQFVIDNYYQTSIANEIISGSLSDVSKITEEELTFGHLPQNDREVVLDVMALDKNFGEEGTIVNAGFKEKSDLVGEKVKVGKLGEFTIVGLTDKQSPSIYMDRNMFHDVIASSAKTDVEDMDQKSFVNYDKITSHITVKKGRLPVNDYEVMISEKNQYENSIGSKLDTKINGNKLKVVGYYSDDENSDLFLVNENMIKYSNIANNKGMIIMPHDKFEAMESLSNAGLNVGDSYEISKAKYKEQVSSAMNTMLIMAAVIFIISIIEIYLMMRASFLSRIKEVGVYRAIGMKKLDIYKLFMGEIIAITTLASMPGFAFMGYILSKLTKISILADQFMFNGFIVILGLVAIYGLNLLFGLLPVWRTVRKTPAEILARTDI